MSYRNGAEWLPGTAGAEPRGSAAAPEKQREGPGGDTRRYQHLL